MTEQDALARVKAAVDPDAPWPDIPHLLQDLRALVREVEAGRKLRDTVSECRWQLDSKPVGSAAYNEALQELIDSVGAYDAARRGK